MSPITTALTALRAEAKQLDAQLTKVRQAINLLTESAPNREKAAKQVRKKRTRKPMTAAQKKMLSAKLKQAWARRKKAAKGKKAAKHTSKA